MVWLVFSGVSREPVSPDDYRREVKGVGEAVSVSAVSV